MYAFLLDQLGVDYTRVQRGPWSGGVTPTSATVKAKLDRDGLRARLVVSTNEVLTNPIYSDYAVAETNHYDMVAFTVENLAPDTRYDYAVEVDGRLELARRGEFRTFPTPGPASFHFAFASCAHTGSTSDVFD